MAKKKGAAAPKIEVPRLKVGARRLAKQLLDKLRAGNVHPAIAQFHPRFEEIRDQPKLADAQLMVARMQGYRSWPQMKHHEELRARCRQEIEDRAPAPDGDRYTAHVRCGSDIQAGLERAGYRGEFIEFADPLCQGPVIGEDVETFLENRASFVAHAYELDLDRCRQRTEREWIQLGTLGQYERVVLWFEGDSYDQLILAAILARLTPRHDTSVQLICVAEYPGRADYRGLGDLDEVSLRALWQTRRPVTEADHRLGTAVWEALFRSDPVDLFGIAVDGTPDIPPMARALRRHLMELPWEGDGLSLTQRLALEAVRVGGDTAGAAFRTVNTRLEPLPYLGDTMFGWELRELAAAGAVTLTPSGDSWHSWGVSLTKLGEDLLMGRDDYRQHSNATRWVGGIPCGAGHPDWRWSPTQSRPIRKPG